MPGCTSESTTLHGIQIGIEQILQDFKSFIRDSELLRNHYRINEVVSRYWMDVQRIHRWHKSDKIDCHKIAGYLTYWICKIKPIEAAIPVFQKSPLGYMINELLALYVGLGRINETRSIEGKPNVRIQHLIQDKFLSDFLYTLRYRCTTGDSLALIYYFIDRTS